MKPAASGHSHYCLLHEWPILWEGRTAEARGRRAIANKALGLIRVTVIDSPRLHCKKKNT